MNPTLILQSFESLREQYTELLGSLSEEEINKIPFPTSWPAAFLVDHITKANESSILKKIGRPAERAVDEQVPQFRTLFLDFELKMKTPDFLIPEDRMYSKKECIERIENVFNELKFNTKNTNLEEILDTDGPLGSITKWELINFIDFHSQRHLHQLKGIVKALRNES